MLTGGCPVDGCTRGRPAGMPICRQCWLLVPAEIREVVIITWAGGAGAGTLGFRGALMAAAALVNRDLPR